MVQHYKIFFLPAIIFGFFLILFFNQKKGLTKIFIGETPLLVEIVFESSKLRLGLGNREYLSSDQGMLFVYKKLSVPRFWMKNMRFPIDIIWMRDKKIVGIEYSVPVFSGGTDMDFLLYRPPVPIDAVLEVNAGFSKKHDLKRGDSLLFAKH